MELSSCFSCLSNMSRTLLTHSLGTQCRTFDRLTMVDYSTEYPPTMVVLQLDIRIYIY